MTGGAEKATAPDPDGDDDATGPVEIDVTRAPEPSDAAVGISRIGPGAKPSAKGREVRNARERRVRSADRQAGVDPERKAVADIQKVLAVAADPATYELAETLPVAHPSGQQRHYPPWVWMVIGAGIEAYGNAKAAITQLEGPLLWDAVLREAERTAGRDETRRVRRDGPPPRATWTYLTRLWQEDQDSREAFHEAFRHAAAAKALAQGRLDPAAPFSVTDPNLDHYVHADGVIMGSPSRALTVVTADPDTGGLLLCRYDNGRGLWWQGGEGNRAVHGSHWNVMWNRGGPYGTRLVLDARHQPQDYEGGEGAMLLEMFLDLIAIAPGTQGCLTDGIWRDKHLRRVFDTGRVAIAPVAALRKGKDWRVEKHHALPDAVHQTPVGQCRHTLVAEGGAVMHKPRRNSSAGGLLTLPVTPERRERADSARFYLLATVPCPKVEGGEFGWRVPVAHFAKDETPFARQEYLRLYAPGSPIYGRAYPRRFDAEGGNRELKRRLPDDRLPAYGPERQQLVMLMKGHTVNAVSQHLHQHPEATAPRRTVLVA